MIARSTMVNDVFETAILCIFLARKSICVGWLRCGLVFFFGRRMEGEEDGGLRGGGVRRERVERRRGDGGEQGEGEVRGVVNKDMTAERAQRGRESVHSTSYM